MSQHMENPATLTACGVPVTDLAGASINSENSLETLRAQYLAEIFALPADTAATIAGLAFGEVRQ
jgi:hypothetical protein